MKTITAVIVLTILLFFVGVESNSFAQTKTYSIDQSKPVSKGFDQNPIRKVLQQDDKSLTLEYDISSYSVSVIEGPDKEKYQLININSFGLSYQLGSPALPVRTEKIAIPKNTTPRIRIVSSGYIELDNFLAYPAQTLGTDGFQSFTGFKKDEKIYQTNKFEPAKLSEIVDIQTYRGTDLAFLQIRPVQYNPGSQKVRIYKNLKVRIEFMPKSGVSDKIITKTTYPDLKVLKNAVVNSGYISDMNFSLKSGTSLQPIGYIIITVPQFAKAAEKIAQWKRQLGYHVEIQIQPSWTISQVKTTVSNLYSGVNVSYEYLLILGDQDHVPDYYYENLYANPKLYIYSENYYACMDGSNDYIPELAHGRISVRDSAQADLVVSKIINYEKTPPIDPSFYQKGLHAGYFQDSARDGISDKRYEKTTIDMYNYMTSLGFQSDLVLYTEPDVIPEQFNAYYSGETSIPPQYLKENGYPWDGDKFDIINALNDGRLYAFHRDHGLFDQWMQPNFTVSDIDGLTNKDELPVVFSVNCESGLFALPEPSVCFAEKLQRFENGGAVGIIAASEETRSGYNDGFIMGMMDAIWSNPGYIPDMGAGGETISYTPHEPIYTMGDVMIQGLIRMTETWDPSGWADKDQFETYHYFGDPAMRIWTHFPTTVTATHTAQLKPGDNQVEITGSNCLDGLATLCIDNELAGLVRLSGGSGTINLSSPVSAKAKNIVLTISGPNYRPYISTIEFIPSTAIKIMPLGNSITYDQYISDSRPAGDHGGYRKPLYDLLNSAGLFFDFVGSEVAGQNLFTDPENAGFPGITAAQIVHLLQTGFNQKDNIQETPGFYLDSYAPDIILLEIGTNGFTTSTADLENILNEINNYNTRSGKNTKTVIAQIINRNPNHSQTSFYNENIASLVNARADSNFMLVDMENDADLIYSLTPTGNMVDTYHPDEKGYEKIAQLWVDEILRIAGTLKTRPAFVTQCVGTISTSESYYYNSHAIAETKPTYQLNNAPSGMTIDSKYGTINWQTPAEGNYSFTISAQAGLEQSMQTINLTVTGKKIAGYNVVMPYPVFNPNRRAQAIIMPENGTLQCISIYHQAGSGQALLGVYSDSAGFPSARLSGTALFAVAPTEGWQTVPLLSPVALNSGTKIWLAWTFENPPVLFYGNGTPGRAHSPLAYTGVLPAKFGTSTIADYQYSIYTTYLPGTLPVSLPDAPANLSAIAGVTSINISWSHPMQNTSGFNIERKVGNNSFTLLASVGNASLTYTDTVLENSVTYTYRVVAYNTTGTSAYSNEATAILSSVPPPILADIGYSVIFPQVTSITNRRAQQVTATQNGNIKSISMYHGASSGNVIFAVYADKANAPDSLLGITLSVAALQTSGWQTINLNSPIPVFAGEKVWLAWLYQNATNIYYDNGTPGRAHSDQTWSGGMPVSFGNVSFTDYIYSIYASITPGTITSVAPAAPSNIMASYSGGLTVSLTWTDNADNETGFIIERKVNNGTYDILATVLADVASYSDIIPQTGNTYTYRLKAINLTGESTYAISQGIIVPEIQQTTEAGYHSIFSLNIYNGNRRAQKIIMPETGTIEQIAMYHGNSTGNLIYAVYSDNAGSPGTLLAISTVTPASVNTGWQMVSLTNPVSITAGVAVWLAWIYQYPPQIFYEVGGDGRANSDDSWSGGMPAIFGASSILNYKYSIYAVYNTTALSAPPSAPTNLTYTLYDKVLSAALSWTDNSANENNFILERGINETYTPIATLPVNTNSYIDNSMVLNQTYKYRVKAVNNDGPSDYSNTITVNTTPILQVELPLSPANFTVSYNNSYPKILLSWTDLSNNETGFNIEKSVNGGNYMFLASISSNDTLYEDSGISYGNLYQYRLNAFNSAGISETLTSDIVIASVPPAPPIAPSALNAVYNYNGPSIILNWADNSAIEDGYVLERSSDSTGFNALSSLGNNVTSYEDFNISYNKEYKYRSAAFNSFGNSGYSDTSVVYTSEPGTDPVQVGYTSIFNISVFTIYRRAQQVTIHSDGIVKSISMYMNPVSSGNYLYGVYNDNNGAPGLLLATTAVTQKNATTSWNTANLLAPLQVTAGQKIWLAWVFQNGTEIFYTDGTPGRAHSGETWTGALPSGFGPSTFTDYIYSIYASVYPLGTKDAEEINPYFSNPEHKLLIYPNPLKGNVLNLVITNLKEDMDYNVTISDLTGRTFLNENIRISPGNNELYFNKPFDESMLILRLNNQTDQFTEKIIVQK